MYVRCNPNKKNIKYFSYVRGYRDENGKTKQVTIEKIGDWKDLIKLYDDPVKHFNDIAKEREKELFSESQDSFQFSLNEELEDNTISIELYVILQYGTNISTVANNIIDRVKYTVEKITSINVSKIDINVQGIRVK